MIIMITIMMTVYKSQMKVPRWHKPLSTSPTTNIFDSNLRRLRSVPNDDVDNNYNDDDDNECDNDDDDNECDKNSW